jgi:hypothetical protein
MPHFGQSLGALIIGGESLTRSLSFLLRKMLSEVTPGLQQLNREEAVCRKIVQGGKFA